MIAAASAHGRETTKRANAYAGKIVAVITNTPISFAASQADSGSSHHAGATKYV